jgi:ATP-dependent helicase/nuclease subunit B
MTARPKKRPATDRKVVCTSAAVSVRIDTAVEWLRGQGRGAEVVIVGASQEAAAQVSRLAADLSTFGWHRCTLGRLAGALGGLELARRGLTPASALSIEALWARIVHAGPALGRFASIADRPGLPRALARTIGELRLAGISPDTVGIDADVARLLQAFEQQLVAAKMVDRAEVLRIATGLLADPAFRHDLAGKPVLCLDVPITGQRERDLIAAIASRTFDVLFTAAAGDDRTIDHATAALGVPETAADVVGGSALARLQAGLFSEAAAPGQAGDDVIILSAPGENRECVEIARLVHREAERGARFDRMAILLRSPEQYRAHLEEALGRAGIPVWFAGGSVRPDPAGRALLALLACAAEDLSASRFCEYLSLGQIADPAVAGETSARHALPDDDLVPDEIARASDQSDAADRAGDGVCASRIWERLIVDAAVIGGAARWKRRLADRARALSDHDARHLASLRAFALPLLEDLQALSVPASWGEWVIRLSALATRAIGQPASVLQALAALDPMRDVGPVDLTEVRLVLGRRLTVVTTVAPSGRYGKVFVGSVEQARGLGFEVVFVPGLAERLFPQKVTEDPILRDEGRMALGGSVATNADRSKSERVALRLAAGAAGRLLVISYPRMDTDQSRPRTPSFYGLEVLRAAEGTLPGWRDLAERADRVGQARLGWPAPSDPAKAIDEAEHDLALLATILEKPEKETVGTARYLLSANTHLGRALRFRGRRWNVKAWNRADGLVDPVPEASEALALHGLSKRSFSPTALQHYAACPYRFALYAIHKLAVREEPAHIEEIDALQRGSLFHEVVFGLLSTLREKGLLPVTDRNIESARAHLDAQVSAVAARYKEELSPAIDRVWDDGIDAIKADLREWLRRAATEDRWVPAHFELSFGLAEPRDRDPKSTDEPVELDCGIKLRGSIDLVERSVAGAIRATDHKTGKVRADGETVIGGGQTLQPVLYALALEKIFPGEKVESGRLYYCTSAGDFTSVDIPLGDAARRAADAVASAIGTAISEGFLPAAPADRACEYCDYQAVCGPYEELRATKVKRQDQIAALLDLRSRP